MVIQIEAKTRQFVGLVIVAAFVIAMIWTGKIPVTVYQHWEGLLVGALFYHVIRMLNAKPADEKADHIEHVLGMVKPVDPIPPKEG